MAGNGTLRDPMGGLRDLCSAEIWGLKQSKLREVRHRMEASFYASDGYTSVKAMEASGFEMENVGARADVWWFGPFSRRYVEDEAHGVPFLSSSNMMEARPRGYNIISTKHTNNLDKYIVREGYILVSCSGTIGNVALVTKDIDGWAVSQHAIRVIPTEPDDLGQLYCYLQSPIGQFLVKRSMSGSVVQSIYEADVSTLPLPRLPRALREELTRLVKKASALRVEANRLLDEAEEMVYKQNYIERPDPLNPEDLSAFSVSSSALWQRRNDEGYCRFDSKFHLPHDTLVRQVITSSKRWKQMAEIADVLLIGKTFVPGVNKVEQDYGEPYFTGKELFAARIIADTWITSKKRRDIDKLIVQRGTTLVTCAGTSGRVAYVGGQLEGSTVTHDAMRVTPSARVHGGYLYAFLACELGGAQLRRAAYGSVHSRLHDSLLNKFVLPVPEDDGVQIGERVDRAFDLQADATRTENDAIQIFLTAIKQGRKTIESEWGDQY